MTYRSIILIITIVPLSFLIPNTCFAQIVVIESTTDGFLPPRMNTAERDAIPVTAASDGMIIFNLTTGRLNYYDSFALQWFELHRGAHVNIIDYFRTLPNGIQTLLDAGETPINIINEGADTSAFIGLNYEGGIIFYMRSDGTGLVAATTDQSIAAEWGCFGTDLPAVPNVTIDPPSGPGAEIGDGSTNTTGILSVGNCPSAPAALACTNYTEGGHSDWFLPSAKELDEMYQKIGQGASGTNTNIGEFADSFYWSSSEFDDFSAWFQIFDNGNQSFFNRISNYRVRAIRAF